MSTQAKQQLSPGLSGFTPYVETKGEEYMSEPMRKHFTKILLARDRERKLIKKIDKTLQLIEDEEYGWCDSCGIEIGIRRLEARPTADLCIDCKTLAEIKEKQVGK